MLTSRTVEIMVSVVIAVLTALVGSSVCIVIVALPFRWLWNAIVVTVFDLAPIAYVQAVGLLALVTLATAAAKGMSITLSFRGTR